MSTKYIIPPPLWLIDISNSSFADLGRMHQTSHPDFFSLYGNMDLLCWPIISFLSELTRSHKGGRVCKSEPLSFIDCKYSAALKVNPSRAARAVPDNYSTTHADELHHPRQYKGNYFCLLLVYLHRDFFMAFALMWSFFPPANSPMLLSAGFLGTTWIKQFKPSGLQRRNSLGFYFTNSFQPE